MKKTLVTTSLVFALGFGTLGAPISLNQVHASAAVLNAQNNQASVNAKADELIQLGTSLIGKATYSNSEYKPTYPYKFSCATFLMYIFEKAGVDLATYNEDYMIQQGTYVPRNQLQKGDLVFFRSSPTSTVPNHVAMYIGDNKVIHMADPKQNIIIADMDSKPYYTENYMSARRVLPTLLPSNPATKGDTIVEDSYNLMKQVTIGKVNDEKSLTFTGSGFVNYVYEKNGVHLNQTNLKELMKQGTTVSRSDLKKGDLVFFNSVTGSSTPTIAAVYAGDHRIIVPSSSGISTRVLFVDYYETHYITAKRVFTENSLIEKPAVTKADQLVDFASNLIGKASFRYNSYDENTLEFTGAGFTYYVYKNFGVDLNSKLASRQSLEGQAVQKADLQKGDLLFFSTDNKGTNITQPAIYIGDNQFIYLSTKGSVVKDNLDSIWAKQNYVTASRVL
ncbi:peptidoglycan hydrolase [Neobacillus bataviensis LMG 21833]|uniref:Peptidoglycan hydrolase n=1 Tax=Neobacillus bataviensis LMG 21833 TaxID=1117379 RepID=K6DF07_9BACI|nr:NlpC/P60 family protein [Neobacillus bataviensis]EKN66653.1 peptidoglycan hydrolase [Neobacillus bataviensis LMG 21833]